MGRLILGPLLFALCFAAIGGGATGGRPDLTVTAVSVAQHGAKLSVADTVRNVGAAKAPPSTTAYFLGSLRIGARAVRRLAPHALSHGAKTLVIPANVPPGTRTLRVCADAADLVRETSERNNCRTATTRVLVRDRTPPTFAGIVQATFCAPGPIGYDRMSRYFLRWERARDTVTAPSDIVYDIYTATTSGAESFAKPTYSTKPGATSFSTPPLPTDVGHYFVVRARDRAGNHDANTVERQAVSICV